jgi:hypothetical protein
MLEAYRRWDNLSPQEKERYKQQARTYAQRAKEIATSRSGGQSGRRGRRR